MSIDVCRAKIKAHLKEEGLDRRIPSTAIERWANELDGMKADSLTKPQLQDAIKTRIEGYLGHVAEAERAARAQSLAKALISFKTIQENSAQFKLDFAEGKRGLLKLDSAESLPFEAARAWVSGGSLRAGRESNISTLTERDGVAGALRRDFNSLIRPIKEVAASGKIDRNAFRELWALYSGEKLGTTNDPAALEYAKAIKLTQDKIFQFKQALNPLLGEAKNFVMSQFHDPDKVGAVKEEDWVGAAYRAFGDKSFPGESPAKKVDIFRGIYKDIVNGDWGSAKSEEDYFNRSTGSGNILRGQAASRTLIMSNVDDAWEYVSKFGHDTLYENLDHVISRSARDVAILDKFGAQPDKTFKYVKDAMRRNLSGAELDYFNSHESKLDEAFTVAMGRADSPLSGKMATAVHSAMVWQYLTKIGGIFHAVQDTANLMSLARGLNGKSIIGNAYDVLSVYTKALLSNGFARQELENARMFWQSGHSELLDMMGAPQGKPGAVSRAIENIGSLNLYERHIDAIRAATANVVSKILGDHANLKYESLPDTMRRGLLRYGIDANEWEAIRSTGLKQLYGHNVIISDAVENMPNAAAEKYLRDSEFYTGTGTPSQQKLNAVKYDLSRRVLNILNEHARLASATPDVRQRTFLFGDTNINSAPGMLLRMIQQFHGAALTTNDIYRRGYFSGSAPKGDYAGVAQHMAMALFLGTLAEYAKQFITEGKTPESPTDPNFIARMAANTGFAGIYADTLVNAMDRSNVADRIAAATSGFVGPVIGTAAEGLALGGQALSSSRDKKLGLDSVEFLRSNLPLQNLWATKAALNYYLWNGLKNFAEPGYLGRLASYTSRTPGLLDQHQQYIFAKPERPFR